MNKETRTFIFGMFLFVIGCFAFAARLYEYFNTGFSHWYKYISSAAALIIVIIGANKIFKTID